MSSPQITWDDPGPQIKWDDAVSQPTTSAPNAGLSGPSRPAPMEQSALGYMTAGAKVAGGAIGNVVVGAGKSALQPLATGASVLYLPPEVSASLHRKLQPQGTAQQIGAIAEQGGELALTGGALGSISKGIGALGRIGLGGANVAANAAAHGQDVAAGAAIGGLSAGMGELAAKIAPKIAESALGTRYSERMYGRNPGQTVIDKTSGVTPDAVAKSAKAVSLQMVGQLESGATAAEKQGVQASTRPALDILDDAIGKAIRENNATELVQLQQAKQQLTNRLNPQTGNYDGPAIPDKIGPRDLLDLKRGFGDTVTNWGRIPEKQGVSGVLKQAYHALDAEFDNAVPGAASANQAVSTLIGITKDAQRRAVMPGMVQRIGGRMVAHTGALTGAAVGSVAGYQRGGVEGGIVGGLAGLVAPEVMGSPTGQMALARGASSLSGIPTSAGVPAFLTALMNRKKGQ